MTDQCYIQFISFTHHRPESQSVAPHSKRVLPIPRAVPRAPDESASPPARTPHHSAAPPVPPGDVSTALARAIFVSQQLVLDAVDERIPCGVNDVARNTNSAPITIAVA